MMHRVLEVSTAVCLSTIVVAFLNEYILWERKSTGASTNKNKLNISDILQYWSVGEGLIQPE